MNITVFGILWIVLIVLAFKSKNIIYMINITLFSMLFQCCNVFEVGDIGVGPQIITSFSLIVKFKSFKSNITEKQYYYPIYIYFLLIIYILIQSILVGQFNSTFLKTLQLLVYLYCAYTLTKVSLYIDENNFIRLLIGIVWFLSIFSIVQYFATIGLIPRKILEPFFFNEIGDNVYFHHPERYQRLLGTFLEPSFCAPVIAGMIIFVVNFRNSIKYSKILLVLLFMELLLTRSSTGFLSFFIGIIIYFIFINKKIKVSYVFILIVVIVLFYNYFKNGILNEVIFDKMNSNSGKYRMLQDESALELFFENKFWGIGLSQIRSSSMIFTLLAGLGILGLFIYICFFLSILFQIMLNKNEFRLLSLLFVFILCISQFISVPDLQWCGFWLAMYIYALSPSNYN